MSLIGLFAMVGLAWTMSSRKKEVPWRIVIGGLALQLALGVLVLRIMPSFAFDAIRWTFEQMEGFVSAGSGFLFSEPADDEGPRRLVPIFAFKVLPTIIFFSSLMSVLYYVGVIQIVVRAMAAVMQKTLRVSGAESLSAAANVFVGHTEAPLVIKPYLNAMTRSELNAVMVGGFSTISGGLLAVYSDMGIDPGHLVTASVISAPAALLIAKVMQPETDESVTAKGTRVRIARQGANVIEAAAIGASDGLKLALNVGAMLIAFLALIAMLNAIIMGIGSQLGQDNWSMENILSVLFTPIALLMGIPWDEAPRAGELLGVKMVLNEFIAYDRLASWLDSGADAPSHRTSVIMTYALSGFSNFGAIGIQIGGIGGLVPERRSELARLGLRAMIGGAIACCMTACVAGLVMR
ncbi:MAG: nucleoside transporter C-terminal domain-containing protein [Pirellulaceae bacterium]|nr:nucleoside transporter C-terminal domain-containing protein [Pirellulaceae bacterium]